MLHRRTLLAGGAALTMLRSAGPAAAHHGWSWTDTGEFQLVGMIREARLGNPHGVLTVEAGPETWTAEIGQPWRNERAGLTPDKLRPGTEITLIGHRSADAEERRMKAERVVIAGTLHDLYPGRT